MIKYIKGLNSNALFDILLLSNNATAIYTGENLTIQLVSQAMLEIWGKDKNVIGKDLDEVIPELKGKPFIELLKNVWLNGSEFETVDVPVSMLHGGDVQTQYFDFRYRAIRDENDQIQCVLHTATDVTKRVEAWKIVKEKEIESDRLNLELKAANAQLQHFNDELATLNEEYRATNEELLLTNEQIETLNSEYLITNEELNEANLKLKELSEELGETNEQLHQLNFSLNKKNTALLNDVKEALSFFYDTPFAIALLKGEEHIIEQANATMLELWDVLPNVVGTPLLTAIPELVGQSLPEILNQVYKSGKNYNGFEQKITVKRNGYFKDCYFDFIYKPIKTADDNTVAIMVVASDVSRQIEARKMVEENNERLSLALNAGNFGSYDLDFTTGLMECSDQCKRNFGINISSRFDFPDLMSSIIPEDRTLVQQHVENAIKTNSVYDVEYRIKWPDGSLKWIKANGIPRYDNAGNAIKMIGVTQDITQRKFYEQRKDDFLSVASHELKTPLTSLKGNLQLLDKISGKLEHPMAGKLINSANQSMSRISSMIDELLDLGKHVDGKMELHYTEFDISVLLNNSCTHVRDFGKHEIVVKSEPILLVADEHRIEQVITNFVNNAVKYAADSKVITISTALIDDKLRVSVIDYGMGIPEQELPQLFDRYYQGQQNGKKGAGLGLGLYISAEIIKKHGGDIGANSTVGSGSTFWFEIPVKPNC